MRVSPTATIDRRVRPDLDFVFDDDPADLGDLVVGAVRAVREAEPVAADDGAVLEHHPVSDLHALANRHAAVDHAVVADLRVAADGHVRMHDRAIRAPSPTTANARCPRR